MGGRNRESGGETVREREKREEVEEKERRR